MFSSASATAPQSSPSPSASFEAPEDAVIALSWADLAPHRPRLVMFARRRLMDPSLAEDLVHDVFEAVVTGRARFGGKSALGTWLVGVLKHKIVDLVRQRTGHDSLDRDEDDEHAPLALVSNQPGPAEVAEQRQLLQRVLQRIAELPDNLRRVVELRLLQEGSTAEVCKALKISEQNLFVRLHRARRVLMAA